MKLALLLVIQLISTSVFAEQLFVLKKSFNPKNVLHFKAHVEACKLKSPGISNYWLMGEEKGQIENLTSSERPFFAPKITYHKDAELDFKMGVLDKLGERLDSGKISVRVINCTPKAFIEVKGQEIQVKEIYAEVGLLMKVKNLIITGISSGGELVKVNLQ